MDIPYKSPKSIGTNNPQSGIFSAMQELQVGAGNRAFKGDNDGIWLGSNKFADAPFRVDMQGRMVFQSANGNLVIDAANNRIIIYDASNIPRILIGYDLNGF